MSSYNYFLKMNDEQLKVKEIGLLLLEIGSLLMSSGASTARTRLTVNRISETFGYETDFFITNRALMLSIHDENNANTFSSVKRTSPHSINFKILSGISRMSWRVQEENWNIDQIKLELDRLISLPHYPRWLVLLMISLAGSSFCRLFGGGFIEMLIAFLATLFGLYIRQEATKLNFNPYLCVYFAALTSTLIAGASVKFNIGISPELAFSASVLFLIPGVPLINMVSDIVDGNVLNAVIRGVNGLTISLAIALGLMTSMKIYQL
jgi:uncharacterized membrane protein YjjP (DUF1212 family)